MKSHKYHLLNSAVLMMRSLPVSIQGGFKGTVIMVPLKVHEASSARDALGIQRRQKMFNKTSFYVESLY
jgi:hypothetical protein